ncbi:hypothetical protein GF407_09255 [candidate division KSB1 bacterium]|nr:hypothetical protein [candidate division KSB1 bacterium]
MLPIHAAQILTCMKLAGVAEGLLINFNVNLLRDGIGKFVLNSFVIFVSFVVVNVLWVFVIVNRMFCCL